MELIKLVVVIVFFFYYTIAFTSQKVCIIFVCQHR